PVADAHLVLIGPLRRRRQARHEIGLAFLLDGSAQENVPARAIFAILEYLHRLVAPGRSVDGGDDLVLRHGFVHAHRGERRGSGGRNNDGQNGRTETKTHRMLLSSSPW